MFYLFTFTWRHVVKQTNKPTNKQLKFTKRQPKIILQLGQLSRIYVVSWHFVFDE